MGFPAVTIRDSMERPEAMETGHIEMCGISANGALAAVQRAVETPFSISVLPDGYEVDNFSERVLRFVMSTVERHEEWMGLRK